ncbi:fluoride efflux transporter CrcB [Streptomyces sp. NPDC048297]|uniref:fluoride efflux transporter CrcB n=1 Tax=Streptomyces sp. NPDC048297 TaxID=3365531 RepID=UPI00371A4E99
MRYLLVALGGAVGAPLRYLIDRSIQARHNTVFPWGTFAANITGAMILGVLTGAVMAKVASPDDQFLLGVGVCGALTTYSTFSYETLSLFEAGSRFFAAANVIVSVVAGLGALFVGLAFSQAVF